MSTNIAHLLTDTGSWARLARTGRKGKWAEVPVVQDAAVPCRVRPASAQDYQIAAQKGLTVTHAGYFDAAWGGQPGDTLDLADGRSFLVRARMPPSKADYHAKVMLEERQSGRTSDDDV